MEETKDVSVKSVAIKYGLINAFLSIIFFLAVDLAGQAGNQSLSWFGIVISGAVIYFAHREFLSGGDNYMSYSQGLGIGTLLSLVNGVISGLFTYLYVTFVNTSFIDAVREKSRMDLEEQGLSDAQIDQAMSFSESFTTPIALAIIGIISSVFLGFIISLIISAITKKNRPEFQ
ncbi:MAG: DUF4199 domain-containing protein [Cyclobacteriaceae bacterium]